MPIPISTTLYTDPACPWGYSASPALRVLEWRYGSQLDWRLVVIGLTENAEQYVARGFTPLRIARGTASFRRYGMPFALEPKARASATARACRAIVAARLSQPGSEWKALRALQLMQFTTPLILEDDARVSAVVAAATGVPPATVLEALDSPAVTEAYVRDRQEARSAAGTAAERQAKTAVTDEGIARYTAPSLVFERDGSRLVAGGFQPVEAYDVLISNLDPAIERREAPRHAAEVLEAFPDGLTTQEVAAIMTSGNDAVDRQAAELALLELVSDRRIARIGLGDDGVWLDPAHADALRSMLDAALSSSELEAVGF
jgi:protein-disulfide isomerase-like protein with CxxC motif